MTKENGIKITVATVVYNPGDLLRRTIASVEEQDYAWVEHLIVDGNSQDETMALVHHYQERNSVAALPHEVNCLSEPDHGLYDAMNKALHLATGRYVVFLNAGDCFHSAHTLRRVGEALAAGSKELPAVVYGDTDIVDGEGHFLRRRRLSPPEHLNWKSFRQGMLVCHQAFFARTDLARATLYNLHYRYSADVDWCIRILREAERRDLTTLNLHDVVCNYLEEGMTTRHHGASLRERFRIMCSHYGVVATSGRHLWFVVRALMRNEFVRFATVGVVATVLHYAVYWVLQRMINVNVAYTIGYALSFVANFFMTSYFTFRKKASVKKGVGFGMAHAVNYLLQMVCLNFFLWLHVPKPWAPLPVFSVCIPVNFLLVRFVFKR